MVRSGEACPFRFEGEHKTGTRCRDLFRNNALPEKGPGLHIAGGTLASFFCTEGSAILKNRAPGPGQRAVTQSQTHTAVRAGLFSAQASFRTRPDLSVILQLAVESAQSPETNGTCCVPVPFHLFLSTPPLLPAACRWAPSPPVPCRGSGPGAQAESSPFLPVHYLWL